MDVIDNIYAYAAVERYSLSWQRLFEQKGGGRALRQY